MEMMINCADGDVAASHGEYVALRDGGYVLVRPLQEHDRPSVVSLFADLSPESRAYRFLSSSMQITPAIIDRVTTGHALVATSAGCVVALGSFHPQHDPTLAEVALVVADREQRRGIGAALSRRLLHDARCAGIRRLSAEVADSNRGLQALIRALDVPFTRTHSRGVIRLEADLYPGPAQPRH
jgi:acetyltransferase